jgi:hypothetical protein
MRVRCLPNQPGGCSFVLFYAFPLQLSRSFILAFDFPGIGGYSPSLLAAILH